MPRISVFCGITIAMFWDESHHATPHFHARSAGRTASFEFDGKLIVGSLPAAKVRLVRKWARLHRDELSANWERARRDVPLETIDPLP